MRLECKELRPETEAKNDSTLKWTATAPELSPRYPGKSHRSLKSGEQSAFNACSFLVDTGVDHARYRFNIADHDDSRLTAINPYRRTLLGPRIDRKSVV